MDPAQRAAGAGDVTAGVKCGAIVLDGDLLRLRQLDGVPTDDGTDGQHAPLPRAGGSGAAAGVVHHDLGWRARSAAERGETIADPRELPVDATRDLGHFAGSDVRDADPTEAALVAREGDATSVG